MKLGKFISAVPLFGVLLLSYLLILTILQQVYPGVNVLEKNLYPFKLPSEKVWILQVRDVVIMLGLLTLYIELFKATKASDTTIYEHILSLFVFLAYLMIFLYAPVGADSTFVILGAMSFIDVVAGITITITAARKDLSLG